MKKTKLDELRDIIALDKYGKLYTALPDDGAEQDYVAGEADRRMKLTCTPAVAAVKPLACELEEKFAAGWAKSREAGSVRGELDGGGNFTPGPWETGCLMTRVEVNPPGWKVPLIIADCHPDKGYCPDNELERCANARLIAAAPEMREVLRLLIAHPRWEQVAKLITTSNDRTTNFGVLIPDILAKARGQ